MLPKLTPEMQFDANGQAQVRYTGVWATRALGLVPEAPNGQVSVQKHWEPKNTYEKMALFSFIAFFQTCCALAFTCLGIYHWATGPLINAETNTPSGYYFPYAAHLTMTGLAVSFLSITTIVAFWPNKRGRITKRLVVFFSLPVFYLLMEAISLISTVITALTHDNEAVGGFYIAEVILLSLIAISMVVNLYPASEACISYEKQRNVILRATILGFNTIVGAIIVIYLCFAIYGVHGNFEPSSGGGLPLFVSTLSLVITSLLLLVTLGAYSAIGRQYRSHMIPYIVVGVVALIFFLSDLTLANVGWLVTDYKPNDWHDNAYVAMYALNCLSIVGVTIMVSLSIAFAYL